MDSEEKGWQSLVKYFPVLCHITSHAGCQWYELLHTPGPWVCPVWLSLPGGHHHPFCRVWQCFNPQQLPFCSAKRLLFEDVKLPVKHSLDYAGFIPADDFTGTINSLKNFVLCSGQPCSPVLTALSVGHFCTYLPKQLQFQKGELSCPWLIHCLQGKDTTADAIHETLTMGF